MAKAHVRGGSCSCCCCSTTRVAPWHSPVLTCLSRHSPLSPHAQPPPDGASGGDSTDYPMVAPVCVWGSFLRGVSSVYHHPHTFYVVSHPPTITLTLSTWCSCMSTITLTLSTWCLIHLPSPSHFLRGVSYVYHHHHTFYVVSHTSTITLTLSTWCLIHLLSPSHFLRGASSIYHHPHTFYVVSRTSTITLTLSTWRLIRLPSPSHLLHTLHACTHAPPQVSNGGSVDFTSLARIIQANVKHDNAVSASQYQGGSGSRLDLSGYSSEEDEEGGRQHRRVFSNILFKMCGCKGAEGAAEAGPGQAPQRPAAAVHQRRTVSTTGAWPHVTKDSPEHPEYYMGGSSRVR